MTSYAEGLRRLLAGTAPDGSPVATYRTDNQGLGRKTDSHYDPCTNGLHLCGKTDEGDQPTTHGNWSLTAMEARRAFAWIKVRLGECNDAEANFVLDLQIGGDNSEGLWCNRQGLTALLVECEAKGY